MEKQMEEIAMEDRALLQELKELQQTVVEELQAWAESMPDPDRPILGTATPGRMLSARQIAREVEERTPFGTKLLRSWIRLATEREREEWMKSIGGEPPR